ncbi:MAG: FAD binding domain-containing protein [Bacteroidota bacterium]
MIEFILNNEKVIYDGNPSITLLDFIRKQKYLTGTKEGCREGDCGACTVLIGKLNSNQIEYKTINSCLLPIANVHRRHVVTIEGIQKSQLDKVQLYFIEEGASQCGFCTPGFLMSVYGYLLSCNKIDLEEIKNSVAGNICRCTGYHSILRALEKISRTYKFTDTITERCKNLVAYGLLPNYFDGIPIRLSGIKNVKRENPKSKSAKRIVAGGTDLYVQIPDTVEVTQNYFINNEIEPSVNIGKNRCSISATATFEMLGNSEIFKKIVPDIKSYNKQIASLPIRNSATLAGNIVNASPIGDLTIILLALGSLVITNEKRAIKLEEFYKGYKNVDLKKNEFIEKFEIPIKENGLFNFEKVSKRTHLDIASVNSAMMLQMKNGKVAECRISIGGVAPVPLYLRESSSLLKGKEITSELIAKLIEVVQSEISPISDVRGSAEYKRLLAEQLVKAHFLELFPEQISFGMIA